MNHYNFVNLVFVCVCVFQVAMLLSRSSEQWQLATVRDLSGVRPQSAEVHLHRHPQTVTGEVQSGERQAPTRETHSDPHTLPQVRHITVVAIHAPKPSLSHSPTDYMFACVCLLGFFPCWKKKSMEKTPPFGRRTSPCQPQRGHNWGIKQVCVWVVIRDEHFVMFQQLSKI